jgi:hypothetical protein
VAHSLWIAVRLLIAAAAIVQVTPASADELVAAANSDASVQVSGPWQSSTLTSPGTGSEYLFRARGRGGATVFWPFPSSLTGGRYEVFARWTSGPDRATAATYWVASGDGTQPVIENQQTNGGAWQSLGSFQFEPGQDNGVTLTDSPTGIVVADAIRWLGPSTPTSATADNPAPAAQSATVPRAADQTTVMAAEPADSAAGSTWTVTLAGTDLHAGPDASTDKLASLPPFSYLQVLGYQGEWAYVLNPRARGTAYAPSAALGPSDPPPAWVTASPPSPAASIERMGRTVGKALLAYYPVDDKFAYTSSLGHDVPIMVHDRVQAADGSTWYRVDNGYLAAGSVRLPRPPTRTFSGRWLDADLQEPAMLTAYDGDRVVLNTLAIKGTVANQTPTGIFSIQRRVQDETMDSGTLGVDPHGPGGYHLEHVLYTQYFTSDGASIHYNYWSGNFGYSGSHGCLGLGLQDSLFLWNWADIGTPVIIRS